MYNQLHSALIERKGKYYQAVALRSRYEASYHTMNMLQVSAPMLVSPLDIKYCGKLIYRYTHSSITGVNCLHSVRRDRNSLTTEAVLSVAGASRSKNSSK